FDVSEDYKVIEARLPDRYSGLMLSEIDFTNNYSLLVLTVLRTEETKSIFGQAQKTRRSLGLPSAGLKLQKGDQVVLFGKLKDIEKLLQSTDE
ncbi:MAG: TrkA family potassium uptake protein, partial [Lentimicrobium sp.]|nr:TrkA family potassium uptake protein [Lentimicrobium sp.]